MNTKSIILIFGSILIHFLYCTCSWAGLPDAFLFLSHLMDQDSSAFFIYKDANSGGNHYIPSGWMGDISGLAFSSTDTDLSYSGLTDIKINYQETDPNGWAGIYWQYPENNWGDKGIGLDLSGAKRLTFWARGKRGGEWVTFFAGGINRPPYHDSSLPYQDGFGPVGTGTVRLSTNWQRFTIELDRDYFDIYRDFHLSFFPSGWIGAVSAIEFDPDCRDAPFQGRKAIRLSFNWTAPNQWAGIYWQNPSNNWGNLEGGFDLSGFKNLTFWAKGKRGGETVIIKVGGISGPKGDSLFPAVEKRLTLSNSWQKYTIDLSNKDLSHIIGGFCIVTNDDMCPYECTIYLDDIRFERQLPPQALSHVIGGFGVSFEAEANPQGATIFLDDIQYDKSLLKRPRFIQSFVIKDPFKEAALANAAFSYDNALAMLAYLSRGMEEDIERARLIGRAFAYAQRHDPDFSDGRLRNAYRAGELVDPATGNVLLPGWWDEKIGSWRTDAYCLDQDTGNMAWVMLAWLRFYKVTGDTEFIENAVDLGTWIINNTKDLRGDGGFTGGVCPEEVRQGSVSYSGTGKCWKSTEHNIDLYVTFQKLFEATSDQVWSNASEFARSFVLSMWNQHENHFWTGTGQDGVTVSQDVIPTDCQTWGLLALRDRDLNGMAWAEVNNLLCPPKDKGVSFCGFDFNSNRDGVWFEGTGQAAVAYLFLSDDQKANYYLSQIEKAQDQLGDGTGGIVAAWPLDGISMDTGFGWRYFQRLHVGATAWYIFAKEGYDPYWGEFFKKVGDANGDGIRKASPFDLKAFSPISSFH